MTHLAERFAWKKQEAVILGKVQAFAPLDHVVFERRQVAAVEVALEHQEEHTKVHKEDLGSLLM